MATKKTWTDKLNDDKAHKVKRLDKDFVDIHAGDNMLVATPQIVDGYIKQVPEGKVVNNKTMRKDLAYEYGADNTCPVSTGIFLRIAAEAAYEKHLQGIPVENITPFWRIIDENSSLAKKLACGPEFIKEQREREAIA
ncbi:MAG: hypothetical protein AAFX87_26900 [Bacteroidota bacterium]